MLLFRISALLHLLADMYTLYKNDRWTSWKRARSVDTAFEVALAIFVSRIIANFQFRLAIICDSLFFFLSQLSSISQINTALTRKSNLRTSVLFLDNLYSIFDDTLYTFMCVSFSASFLAEIRTAIHCMQPTLIYIPRRTSFFTRARRHINVRHISLDIRSARMTLTPVIDGVH